MFAEFARGASPRAPLYARLAAGIAADDSIAGLLLHAPPRQRQPVLFLACVHSILLGPAGEDDPLAGLVPQPDRPTVDGRSAAGPAGVLRRAPGRARGAAGDPQHADERDRALPRCCCRRSGCSPPRSGRSPTSTSAPAPGSTCCSTGTTTCTCPAARSGGPSAVTLECGTRGDVPVPTAMPEVVERRGLDRYADRRPRPGPAPLAGGVRVARPDRPLRAAAGGAGAGRRVLDRDHDGRRDRRHPPPGPASSPPTR